MLRIRWQVERDGRGMVVLRADPAPEGGRAAAFERFESVDELPFPWARAIRKDGRSEGETTIRVHPARASGRPVGDA